MSADTWNLVWLDQPGRGFAARGGTIVGVVGPRGARGPTGGERYEHVQASAAPVWTVNHNLGATPAAVTVLSPGGVEVVAEVRHPSVNQCTIHFAAPASGRAIIL